MEKLLQKLERGTKWHGISDLPLYIVIGQMVILTVAQVQPMIVDWCVLKPSAVYRGEIWRLFSFVLITPASPKLFWGAIWCYLFYLYGNSLEQIWGQFRLTIYLLIGYILTILSALLLPSYVYYVPGDYFLSSVFLAFAYLNPEFELLLFFILPVQVRWLALAAWAMYALSFISGSFAVKMILLAGVSNFFIFFGHTILRFARKTAWKKQSNTSASKSGYTHRCSVCGKTDQDDSELEFRYCTKCRGNPCYCMEHLKEHSHLV